ncbi:MAG: uroporphyrinogen decarboxylase family protein [Chloroflexota bacterium]
MNKRERLRAIFNFEKPDRLPVWQLEQMYEGTGRQWCLEGMPLSRSLPDYLGLELPIKLAVDVDPIPSFVARTIEEDEEAKTKIDIYGGLLKAGKATGEVSPWRTRHEIRGPVANREDWERYKKRYDPHDIRRYPKSWGPDLFDYCRTATDPISIYMNWGPGRGVKGGYTLGYVEFLQTLHDDPTFIHAIFDFWADFLVELLHPLLEAAPIDFVFIEEDAIGIKNSTMVSPATYRAFWVPYIRRVVDSIHSHGVRVVGWRSSGNPSALVPVLLEAGINLLGPLETAAGVDVINLRKQYGRELILMGGLAREAFMGDRAAIEKEFYGKVPWLVEQGGYVAAPDDAMMPDWPLDTMRHYVQLVRNFDVK